ncbi:HD domain-containing protein [Clostridium vincentii]|uniref:Multifunctional tRNA nucleotidyl transferase/2'3'-cyclic phosphodiesterase/2'nucleotidase/phosphatase n=1 Tax=Clostridium vincentii TaxID=52704 RepID=A0A2T0BG89_9CLOT|nr:HD domain-containing protein [Clostridium vincentii]PRR82889.1 multifunctional tRNA nucleotidyl transferase/2'3'-cyclic phosphodiesterase/2'nucleotidase/phosphatase [Clostridium vincentii]
MQKNNLFSNIEDHLLQDKKPSVYLEKLKEDGFFNEIPYIGLKKLEGIMQSPKHHPEGNVWVHTMMVVDEGANHRDEVEDKRALMWTLLLHDIGKVKATKLKKGRWVSYDHDKVGEVDGRGFLEYFTEDEIFINKVTKLIRYHMHLLYIINKLPYADVEGMLKSTDINELSIVFLSDRLGRGGVTNQEKEEILREIQSFKKNYSKK